MKTARDKVVGKKARLRSDRMEAQEQPREIIFARCAPAIAMRWHQSVEVVQRSAHRVSKVAQRGEKNREGKLRFENRFSSVPDPSVWDVRDPCVLSYTHERNPSASNSERFLESPHFARSGRFEPSYGQFSFKYSRQEWPSFGNDPSTSLSLFIYLSSSVSLSFFDPNGLFRESMTRESDLKTRRGFFISLRDF